MEPKNKLKGDDILRNNMSNWFHSMPKVRSKKKKQVKKEEKKMTKYQCRINHIGFGWTPINTSIQEKYDYYDYYEDYKPDDDWLYKLGQLIYDAIDLYPYKKSESKKIKQILMSHGIKEGQIEIIYKMGVELKIKIWKTPDQMKEDPDQDLFDWISIVA